MKKILSILLLLPIMAIAQQKIITHTVAAKESFSSIGRLYNINGRELANYNNVDYEKGLSIGQTLKVPVKNDVAAPVQKNEPVVKKEPISKNGEAIYHTVASKETLYGVSKKYGVTVADIKKWNNLTVDGLSEGANIIVGYGNATKKPVEEKKEEVVKTPEEVKPKVAEVKKKEEVVVNKETKPVEQQSAPKQNNGFNGGYFKNMYTEKAGWEASKETGMAAVFKSTSGWEDGKYYCLHNVAPQNSIVKITNNVTGKSIYAKVLDVIPDIKQNNGLLVRLSNAAASELGVNAAQFDCTINYSK